MEFLTDLFQRQVELNPLTTAVQFGADKLSYAQLDMKSEQLAKRILECRSSAFAVGVSASRSFDTIINIFAVLKAGKAYLPLDSTFPKERLQDIIADSGMDVFLSSSADHRFFEPLVDHVLQIDDQSGSETKLISENRTDVAYVIYTSGSTGKPKGVCVGHRSVINLVRWHEKISPYLEHGSRTLQFSSPLFDVSVMEIFCTLCSGGTLVLVDEETRIDPLKLLYYIGEQQVNRISFPFVALQYLMDAADAEQYFPDSLQEVITAGEQLKITPQIIHFFQALPDCVFYNMYGPTESCVFTTAFRLDGDPQEWPLLPPIGKAMDGVAVYVLDQQLNPVPDGKPGELCIAGTGLAVGYLNRDSLTAAKFVNWTDESGRAVRIYRSGDLCCIQPDGNVEYLGRIDTQVKIRGNRVEIGEIEVNLNALPGIQQAAVIARSDQYGQNRLIAYLVSSMENKDIYQLRRGLEQKLPDYMIPSAFVWLDDFAKTSSGKIDRNALPEPNLSRPDLRVRYKAPRTALERIIAEFWSDFLQLDKVGIDDNFFELGGNSILALKTVAALKTQRQQILPISKLYQYPTINGIVSYLAGTATPGAPDFAKKAKNRNHDIAVVGMSARVPGANTIDEFWHLLSEGLESISFFSDQELDHTISSDMKNDPDYVKARGIVPGAKDFDAAFFRISPKLAELMDPQHRVFLELAWEALESSGHLPEKYKGVVGVFAGCGNNTYYTHNILSNPDLIAQAGSFQVSTLNEKDYIATRTAYELNLSGPAVSVHAACSTSLLAIVQAAESIRSGQCDVALAGGASIHSPINSGHLYQQGTMLSADGHCRPFDAESDGTVFSDGAGVVVLKRLEDAERDGDLVYAVLKGVGLNNDGGGKGSFGAPSAVGQAGAIAMAIHDAGVDPSDISYVEAHGTGTSLGDPIEIEGLSLAFGKLERRQFCAIGSVKSNMGHLVAAAGVAGFIKTVLALYHRRIPASLFYKKANPNIDFEHSPFFVNTKLREWESDRKRIAGVSSFGVGGTNVHVILGEYTERKAPKDQDKLPKLISWSARTSASSAAYAVKLTEYAEQDTNLELAELSYGLHRTRFDFQ